MIVSKVQQSKLPLRILGPLMQQKRLQASCKQRIAELSSDVKSSISWSSVQSQTSDEVCEDLNDTEIIFELQNALSMPLNLPIKVLAFSYFINNYIPGTNFGYLSGVFKDSTITLDLTALESATYATALAHLARERQDSRLMLYSRRSYADAIKDVKAVLKTKEAGSINTIAAVLILSLFETIVLADQSSVESWNAHINGVISLFKCGGPKLLQTDIGRRLYIQLGDNVRTNSCQLPAPLPPSYVELHKVMWPHLSKWLRRTPYSIKYHYKASYWPLGDQAIHFLVKLASE
jgi:hypothetical protein